MSIWVRRKILIWGKTRPELSRKHRETVCTGGVFEDTKQFVRLYPIPLRYLDDEHVFKKYQWIEADVRKAIGDARPESYNIRPSTIQVGEKIETKRGDWSERARWVLQPGHTFASVTALQAAREAHGTSIGMVKPDEVLGYPVETYPEDEKKSWWARYHGILQQPDLPFTEEEDEPIRPISPPDFRFKIKFRSGEKEHEFSVFDWEVDALYFNLRRSGRSADQACSEVTEMLRTRVCGPDQDTYFFLGNIAAHPHVFTIVGLWYPKKPKPPEPATPGLFDGVE
jgi:hypothetical protein